ncbi:BatD family protein [Flavobacterium sp.]|uniref:BatD family protein n=1 Tax=Flavobacterium sp. TaxID=239 RepID=UPI0039E3F9E1
MKKYLLLILFGFQGLLAQVQFEAKVSKATLGLNERLRIDFVMNGDGDNFTPPSFEGFRVVGGPSQQISQSWINGRSSFNKSYSYFLLPQQKGTIVIKQASVEINGQVYKTNPVKITVTNAVELPKNPYNTPQISAGEALHLVAEVSKANPYLNEPITVVYKLYFNYNVGITGARELNKPKYNDFWSQNIEIKQLKAEESTYNGERCGMVVLKKAVLYPQKAGKLEIEPLTMDVDVQLPTNRRDFFGRVQIVEDNKRVSAGAKVINVKPLPERGKPVDFTGAVGRFNFKVTPSRTTVKNGESLDLKVAVSGTGNLKLFDIPKPVVPNSLEMYDPVHKENVSTPLSGMNGEISDSYTIITQFKGKYPIKPMSFTYFDLGSGTYKTITSPEIMINVLDGPGGAQAAAPTEETGVSKVKVSSNEQFSFIALKTKLVPTKRKDFLGSGLFYSLLFLPLLIIPIIVMARKKKEALDGDVAGNRIRQSNKLARKYLSEAKKQLGNKELFYIALEKSLHNFLKAKLHIETSEMSKDRIREILLSKNARPETVDDFIRLVENCEFARYAPSSAVAIQQDFDKAVVLISELEKQIS